MKNVLAMSLCSALLLGIFSPDVLAGKKPPMCNGVEATIVGTNGDDIIDGTDDDDVIVGLAGNDVIRGGLGNDLICGGPGDDELSGQGGDDVIFGGNGDDYVDGGQGGCCPEEPNTGDDWLYGGNGNDSIHTSDYPTEGSHLFGGNGADGMFVWSGGEAYGENGDDAIMQYGADAQLYGGNGDDHLINWNEGSDDAVIMEGGRGDDLLDNQDLTGTTDQDGGPGEDECIAGTTTDNCEA